MMTSPWLRLCVLALVALLSCGAFAADFRVPLMSNAPHLDGNIEPTEWAQALRMDGFVWQNSLERRNVSGYIGADATHLYLAIRSQLPAEGGLLADVKRDTENLVYDDSVEVWLDPTPGAPNGQRFQMLANSLGHRWYKQHAYGNVPDNPAWHADWPIANGFHDGAWHCEIAIPLADIAPGRSVGDGAWGINLARNWKQDWAFSALNGDAYAPSDRFIFSAVAPAISYEQRSDVYNGDIANALVFHNVSNAPLSLRASLHLQRDVMPELKQEETITLAPGATKELLLQTNDQATKKYQLTAEVSSPDGQTSYFARHFNWTASGPWRWTTHPRIIPPVDFQFAYYPSLNRMRILADVSNLPHDAKLQSLTATIRRHGGAAIKTISFNALKEGRQEQEFVLPPLQGEHEIALKATGPNVPTGEVVKTFERTVFPWEHLGLGTSAKVYPPFTPIEVRGKRVSTVLRQHEMNDAGLWDQVTATGQPLLAAPMRYAAKVNGADAVLKAGSLRFTKAAPNVAVAQSHLTGAVTANVQTTWDYDGTMRVDLTLLPNASKVENLTLEIPFKAAAATHLHAMGDGIRNTLYQKVPDGDGVVWTAAAVQANDLPKNFCTYLYVGTPVRGLCWFAENDRGWNWNPNTPNLELVRQNGNVVLRIHLINQPTTITALRTITFGLLAAPVKPRLPLNWRHKWRRDDYHLLGTDINWFALGDAASVYPAGKDTYFWEMLKRGNKEKLSEADVQKVIARLKPYFQPYGADKVAFIEPDVRHNLTGHLGAKMVFYYNRASYQAAEEFETFKDEWGMTDWRTLGKGNSIGEIKIVPTASYIDHALYWYGKSFDLGGNQGVYWDNWFFVGSYNTAMTNAYHRDDGTIVPSTGIWGLRELAKRTFQYENERGMPPITMSHMTSTSILPMLSFSTVQYDWEWKYSEGDVQYRFPRDYILLVSNGDLAGTWPVLLKDQGKLEDDIWTGRTFAGVAMVHELDCPYSDYTKTGQMQRALFKPVDDILAQPNVQAYRYWDERPQPITTGNPDLPAIVYAVKGKQAVFAVTSYAESDQTANVAIDAAALGLTGGYRVTDAETGQEIPVTNDRLSFPLKKHDVRVCQVVAK